MTSATKALTVSVSASRQKLSDPAQETTDACAFYGVGERVRVAGDAADAANSGSIVLHHPLHFGDTFVAGGNSEAKDDGRSAVPHHAILVVTPFA
jgi:hypothetical protein